MDVLHRYGYVTVHDKASARFYVSGMHLDACWSSFLSITYSNVVKLMNVWGRGLGRCDEKGMCRRQVTE